MELHKKRRVLGVLLFGIGLLTMLVALGTVSDPTTRHAVGALGVAFEIVGVVVIFKTRNIGP